MSTRELPTRPPRLVRLADVPAELVGPIGDTAAMARRALIGASPTQESLAAIRRGLGADLDAAVFRPSPR